LRSSPGAQGNALGEPIPIGEAERHVAGLNDWSARDIQAGSTNR